MNVYCLYARSRTLLISLFLLYWLILAVTCLFVFAFTVNVDNDDFVGPFLAAEALLIVVAYWLARRTSKRKVIVTISGNAVSIDRENRSLLFRNLPVSISFSDLMVHEYIAGRPSDNFIELTAVKGSTYRLHCSPRFSGRAPAFDPFVNDLRSLFKQYVDAGNPTAITQAPVEQTGSEMPETNTFSLVEPVTYVVKNMSNTAGVIFFFAAWLMPIFYLVISLDLDAGMLTIFGGLGLLVTGLIFLFRRMQQKMEIIVAGDRITVKYLQKFILDSVHDRTFSLSDIKAYKFEDFNGCRFILYLKDGTKFKTAVSTYGKTENITQFAQTVIGLIEHSNENTTAPEIERKKTFYEGTGGLVLSIFLVIVLAAAIIAIIFFPQEHHPADIVRGLGSILSGLGFVLYVYSVRKKSKTKKEKESRACAEAEKGD